MESRCSKCNTVFTTPDEMNKHLVEYHRDSIQCDDCGKVFSSKEELDKHLVHEHHA